MRRLVAFALKAAISAALLYFAVGRTNFALIGERLNRIDPLWMLSAVAVAGAQLVLTSLRWRYIALHCGAALDFPASFRFSLIGTFFNQVLPSSIGGDAVRTWLFARESAGWSKATYSVLLDRFIGVLTLALLVLIGLPWALKLINNPVGRTALLVIGFGSIAASAAFVALAYLRLTPLQRFWPVRHLMQLAATARSLLTTPAVASAVIALSIVIQILTAGIAWCAARAVAAPFEFMHALLLVPPVMLIATVPISIAGWGVRESALMLAFAYAGLAESDGLLVSMLLGAAMLAVGLIGGAVWLIAGAPRRARADWQREHPPPAA